MEWTDEEALKLIDAYRNHSVLWDPRNVDHKNFSKKSLAWDSLATIFNRSQIEIRKKMHSLLASYRRECNKVGTKKASRKGVRIYQSSWFAYESLHFLHYRSKKERSSSDVFIKIEEDDEVEEEYQERTHHQVLEDNEAPAVYTPTRNMQTNRPQRPHVVTKRSEPNYSIVNNIPISQRDEYDTYGEHVANKLRKLVDHDRAIAQHKINNILFEAEMGKYRNVLS